MNVSTPACDDASFGPVVTGCRQNFDFTLAFEQYFFSIVPSAILLCAAPLRIFMLRHQGAKVRGDVLKYAKLGAIAAFSCVQLALLVLWASRQHVQGQRRSALVSVCLSLAATLALLPLSYMEHARSLRPSLLASAYLLACSILEMSIVRSLWLSPGTDLSIRAVFTTSFSLRIVVLGLEVVQKGRFFLDAYHDRSPEESSGLFGQGFMWWLNSLIYFGARHTLKPRQLYPITADMASERLANNFRVLWSQPGQSSIKLGLARLLWWPIFVPVLPRLAVMAFTLCQPLLLSRLLEYLSDPVQRQDVKTGYGLIGAAALIFAGMAIFGAVYWHRQYRFMAMVRGTLMTAVYQKALQLDMTASTSAKTLTLMSADCERITRGLMDLHELWANIIQVALATWLIETQLGIACVAPIAVTLITTILTAVAAMHTPGFQAKWIAMLETRIALTSTILGSMKGIKITNSTAGVFKLLKKLRHDELTAASKFRFISVVTATIGHVPQLISPIITFAILIGSARNGATNLDPARMFTSLSLLFLVSDPLFNLFAGLIEFTTALGCLKRTEQFLLSPSRVDARTIHESASSDESNPNSNGEKGSSDACISVRDGTFGWKAGGAFVLQNLHIDLQLGDIVFVMGPVGCGKSTLIKALLGETPVSHGSVTLSRLDISLCEQSPWIMNQTIRANIIYSAPFDLELYEKVIDCCALGPDFANLDQGDMTMAGSKGFSLSAGQRQRVALARAVYSRRSIALLDDVFSQLDAHTSASIVSRLIGPSGLYRQWGTTVLLTTSSARFLSCATRTIVLSETGRIIERSTSELEAASEALSSDISTTMHKNEADCRPVSTKDDQLHTSPDEPPILAQMDNTEMDDAEPIPEKRRKTDLSIFRFYFAFINWRRATIFMVFQISLAFLSSFPVIWLKWWTDENPAFQDSRTSYYIGVYASLQGAALIAVALVTWWTLNILAVATGLSLHESLANTLVSSTLKLFSSTDSGSLLNRFTQDIQLADVQLPLSLQVVVTNILIGIAQAGLIASASGWIALSYPFLLIVLYLIPSYYVRTARQVRTLDLEEKAPLYAQFLESLEGIATIRAFSWEHELCQQNHRLVDRSQKPFYLMYVIQKWLGLVLDLTIAGLATVVVGVAVALRNTISPGFTGVSLTQIISFTSYLKMMILFWAQLQTAMAAVERIRDFSRDTEMEDLPESSLEPPASWPAQGNIEIEQLSARYRDEAEKATLDAINLSIRAGEKIGICGRTGSGKTSLILCIFRLLDPFAGRILIDGLDISSIPHDLVRARIVGVVEEPFFFPGSVRQNLDLGGTSTDAQIIQALVDCRIWSLFEEGGLDASMTKEQLSHGHRQLFSLARALLRDARVYVFDEASSSLDAETEKIMSWVIETRLKHCTVISVVHKTDSALGFQKVAVMDKARIVEFDSPQALLKRFSKFRELYISDRPT